MIQINYSFDATDVGNERKSRKPQTRTLLACGL